MRAAVVPLLSNSPNGLWQTLQIDTTIPVEMPKILIVDDDEAVLRTMKRSLECYLPGMQLLTAGNGEEAMNVCAGQGRIDLAIVDVCMPRTSGVQVMCDLKAIYRDLRGIFVSGYSACALAAMITAIDVDQLVTESTDLLIKPFLPKALAEKVDYMLTRSCVAAYA